MVAHPYRRVEECLRKQVPLWTDRRQIERLLRPCVVLSPGYPRKSGRSRIGGRPELPVGEAWPTQDGHALSFLMQVDLAEVHAAWTRWDDEPLALPPRGTLYAFANLEDVRQHRVLYRDADDHAEVEFPEGFRRAQRVKAASLQPYRTKTLPYWEDTAYLDHGELSRELEDQMSALQPKLARCVGASAHGYRMLGYFHSAQADVATVLARRRAEREGRSDADAREEGRRIVPLLEVPLDDGTDYTNLHRRGRGAFYWGVRDDELARGEIDEPDGIFQMGG